MSPLAGDDGLEEGAQGERVEPVAPGTPRVTLEWADVWGTRNAGQRLAVSVTSNSDAPVRVTATGYVTGFDGRERRWSLGAFELAPRARSTVELPVDAIPLRDARGASFVAVEVADDEGVVQTTEPAYLRFGKDGVAVFVSPEASGEAVTELEGTELTASGARGPVRAESRPGYVRGSSSLALKPEGWQPDAPARLMQPLSSGATVKLCTHWRSAYTDVGLGEDVWTQTGLQNRPASYAQAVVTTSPGGLVVWSGWLDLNGCTPNLTLASGNYSLVQMSNASFNGRTFNVTKGTGNQTVTVSSAFYWANTSTATITFTPGVTDGAIRAVAVVGRALLANAWLDLGIVSGTYTVRAERDCPSIPGSSCVYGGVAYVTTSATSWKNVVAHELGHQTQDVAMGWLGLDYGLDAPSGGYNMCRCDHVTVANTLHCLQSREHSPTAQVEGWAHMLPIRMFNTANEANAKFVYYKEVKNWSGSSFPNVYQPPYSAEIHQPVRWMETECPTSQRGVEWDWAGFFWKVTWQGAADRSTTTDLHNVYRRACGTFPNNCSGQQPQWSNVRQAAQTQFGGTSAKFAYFDTSAIDHGVDN